MSHHSSVGHDLANNIIDKIVELLLDVEQARKAVEIDPYRGRLFELFVMADAAGFLDDESEHDLSSEGIAKELASRWGLAQSLGSPSGLLNPTQLPPAQLARMRLLWSFMRMWMEWSYAWQRWAEFHGPLTGGNGTASAE